MLEISKVEIGTVYEEIAKKILINDGFNNVKLTKPLCSYDIEAYKNSEKFFIEVRSRHNGSNINSFTINKPKLETLKKIVSTSVLFMFINPYGYEIVPLSKLKDITKTIMINGKQIEVVTRKKLKPTTGQKIQTIPGMKCKKCGSTKTIKIGRTIKVAGLYQVHRCKECRRTFVGEKVKDVPE